VAEISDSDIGKRVTIRLHDEPGYRDIVGHLLSQTSLKNRHGQIVNFDPKKIHLWREIVEVPRTATSGAPFSMRVYDLERTANRTWVAKEEFEIGNWIFRADVGITRRANSALILGNDNHIDQLISWYQARNLQPTVSLVPTLNEKLDEVLEKSGFEKLLDLEVMVKDPINTQTTFDYEVYETPSKEWLAIHKDEQILPLLNRTSSKYIQITNDQELIAIGRIAFADDWAVISRIWVTPNRRGQGFGRKMLQALENESNGAKLALQVRQENIEAYELYKSAGYLNHHSCRFRALPQQINQSHN
jgi:GNAT superfamily N-acetyltransferase